MQRKASLGGYPVIITFLDGKNQRVQERRKTPVQSGPSKETKRRQSSGGDSSRQSPTASVDDAADEVMGERSFLGEGIVEEPGAVSEDVEHKLQASTVDDPSSVAEVESVPQETKPSVAQDTDTTVSEPA